MRFTTLLWRLPLGHPMRIIGPKGRFLLEPNDDRTHLYVSTGTGIAPFISMIRETHAAGDARRTVVLHGCSYVDELGYRDELEDWQSTGEYPITYIPTISRPADPRNAGWTGLTGRVEAVVGQVCHDLKLRPEKTVVYICGNPEMILHVESELMERDFPEFHVKKELYWPKGKDAALLASMPIPGGAGGGGGGGRATELRLTSTRPGRGRGSPHGTSRSGYRPRRAGPGR